jgi:hypothetical protein
MRRLRDVAKLPGLVTAYSIRHTMSREMQRRAVPTEQIGYFLGHLPTGSAATTSIYAPYEPGFMHEAVAAIEDTLVEIRRHLSRAQLDRPGGIFGSGPRFELTSRARRKGIVLAKHQEVVDLLQQGIVHSEIVNRTGVSSGMVSYLRQKLKEAGVLPYRAHQR